MPRAYWRGITTVPGEAKFSPASDGTRVRSLQPTRAGQRKHQAGADAALNYGSPFDLSKALSYGSALGGGRRLRGAAGAGVFYNALRFSDNCSKSDQTSQGEAEAGFDKLNIL